MTIKDIRVGDILTTRNNNKIVVGKIKKAITEYVINGQYSYTLNMNYFDGEDNENDIMKVERFAPYIYDGVELEDTFVLDTIYEREVEIIEEPKKIEKLGYQNNADGTFWLNHRKYNSEPIKILVIKINEIIDKLNKEE